MTLHRHKKKRDEEGFEDIYTDPISQTQLPKNELPEKASNPQVIRQLVCDELFMDGNARQNLATFCTTYIEDEVRALMDLSIDKNMIDKDEYPQTAEIEQRCVNILANLWHAPDKKYTIGCSTTGSSEAAMLAGLALKCSGESVVKHRENVPIIPILYADPYRYVGINLHVTLMLKLGKFL